MMEIPFILPDEPVTMRNKGISNLHQDGKTFVFVTVSSLEIQDRYGGA